MTSTAATSTMDDNITINTAHDSKDQCVNTTTSESRSLFDMIRLVLLFIGVILSMFVMSLNSTVVAP